MAQLTSFQTKKYLLSNPQVLAFLFSMLYWIYLAFNSQMVIKTDAAGYEQLGTLLHQSGWIEYFKTGPNREPFYPWLISISMGLSAVFNVSYIAFQKCFQIIILLLTQGLTFVLLKRLKINKIITTLTLLYLGFSPAIVNSGFSLFSEIATYPFVLGIILVATKSLESIQKGSLKGSILNGFYLAGLFLGATASKAIFSSVLPIFLIPFFILLVSSIVHKNKKVALNSLAYFVIVLCAFQSCIIGYKSLNQKYNGNFTMTDRGSLMFYGNVAKRTEKTTSQSFLAALAYVPGEGFCEKLFDETTCLFWSHRTSDGYGYAKSQELRNNQIPIDQMDSAFMRDGMKKIFKDPFQYLLLTGVESFKIFFWESTKIAFVNYPDWLTKIFDFTLFKNGLRALVALLSFMSFLYIIVFLFKNHQCLYDFSFIDGEKMRILFFMTILMLTFTGLYSLVTILPRYAFPIAPLFLINIAFFLNQWIFHKKA